MSMLIFDDPCPIEADLVVSGVGLEAFRIAGLGALWQQQLESLNQVFVSSQFRP